VSARSITALEFDKALVAMLDAVSAGRGAEQRYRRALLAALSEIDIEIGGITDDTCLCSVDVRQYCHSTECHGGDNVPRWELRTWVDVRTGDFVRPPGVEEAAAEILSIGPVLEWHVNDAQPLDDFQRRDMQYNPGRYAGVYSVRHVTMRPELTDARMTRDMRPEAPVEIHSTAAELRAIELFGGWAARLDAPGATT
jgi:hypothetical protein